MTSKDRFDPMPDAKMDPKFNEKCVDDFMKIEALRGLLKLIDDGDLVRNTDGDGDAIAFMQQGIRIIKAIKAAQTALEKAE